jgi:UDPglucose--hexose-1-phosphate uridylyltransferase
VYHPRQELHHIKKENIGLIEVMGLAVLPARLQPELAKLGEALVTGADVRQDPQLSKHADWAEEIVGKYPDIRRDNVEEILRKEVGLVFAQVLEDAGVYKRTQEGAAAFWRFIQTL